MEDLQKKGFDKIFQSPAAMATAIFLALAYVAKEVIAIIKGNR